MPAPCAHGVAFGPLRTTQFSPVGLGPASWALSQNRVGLLRGRCQPPLTQTDLDLIAAKLNARPRETLASDAPATRFEALLR